MALGTWRRVGLRVLAGETVPVLSLDFFLGVLFQTVRRRLYLEVKIRSSPLYHFVGGAFSTGGGCLEFASRESPGI
jgi:hypothetical protein